MCNKNLFIELENLLRMESTYCTEDGVLIKNAIVEAALALRPELIAKLLSLDGLKRNFFTEVEGVLVFDKVKFQKFVMNKRFLPDSYTSFKNKVGLTNDDGDFLSESREVVLSWPYKDCVLEGGQTKEDAKRNEVFWNEILAPDEINRLTEPKVLTNFKRYDLDGEHGVDSISMDDNLIIKGNNLLALHSLKRKYAGKVKLIYIDPPYNTGNDSFGYNDSFNQSTWLTFMRNRLEIAYKLLSNDGTIAISIDNYELAYTLILLDEIFGRENRKNIVTIKRASASGAKVINPGLVNVVEYIVLYCKDTNNWKPNRVFQSKEYDTRYNGFIINPEEHFSNWKFTTVLEALSNQLGKEKSKLKKELGDAYNSVLEQFVIDNSDRIIRLAALDDKQIGSAALDAKRKSIQNPEVIIHMPREGAKDYFLINGNAILFAKDRMINVDGYDTFGQPSVDIWDDVLPNDLHNEGGVDFKKGKKPEKLISRIVELCSNENELVLDFFAGSGTTGSVCLKMNRRCILCEQMEYAKTSTYTRVKETIKGEQRGISKTYNWQGGGSFVYCELAKANQQFADDIEHASSSEELATIWKQMQETGFLSWKVNPKEINANADDFTTLAIEDQKRFLIECLDKNLLYIPYSEIDNAEFGISENEKQINCNFYGKNRD